MTWSFVTALRLESLRLCFRPIAEDVPRSLLSYLQAPNLEHLEVSYVNAEDLTLLRGFFAPHQPNGGQATPITVFSVKNPVLQAQPEL